jgi:multicomponent Na+:H+ antiporter subunit C
MILVLAIGAGGLFACGIYLLIERTLTRVVIGFAMMSHGANLVLLAAGGRAGEAPIVGAANGRIADPLAQAMILTAIVISFAVTAFMLALAYRSWLLTRDDRAEDDLEDRRIARLEEHTVER